jgi:hypothetical protein
MTFTERLILMIEAALAAEMDAGGTDTTLVAAGLQGRARVTGAT